MFIFFQVITKYKLFNAHDSNYDLMNVTHIILLELEIHLALIINLCYHVTVIRVILAHHHRHSLFITARIVQIQ